MISVLPRSLFVDLKFSIIKGLDLYFPYSISDSVVIGIGVGVGLVVVIIVIVIIIFICYKRKHKYIRKHSKSSNNAYVSLL